MIGDIYTCELCRGTFRKQWGDDEALAEYRANFPDDTEEPVVVCGPCFETITALVPPPGRARGSA